MSGYTDLKDHQWHDADINSRPVADANLIVS